MTLLFALLISLLPLSVFAELPTPPPVHPAPQGILVIPDGQGGVTYWQGQGGTDAGTAYIIGQGMARMMRPSTAPYYVPPPLTVPETPRRSYNDYDQAVHDRMLDYIESRGR